MCKHLSILLLIPISIKFKLYEFDPKANLVQGYDYDWLGLVSRLKTRGAVYNLDEQIC